MAEKVTPPAKEKPKVWRVRSAIELGQSGNPRILHEASTEREAQRYVEQRFPRGREHYVEHPDGYKEHYTHGEDEPWQEFIPED
jgi:hypothetical protein